MKGVSTFFPLPTLPTHAWVNTRSRHELQHLAHTTIKKRKKKKKNSANGVALFVALALQRRASSWTGMRVSVLSRGDRLQLGRQQQSTKRRNALSPFYQLLEKHAPTHSHTHMHMHNQLSMDLKFEVQWSTAREWAVVSFYCAPTSQFRYCGSFTDLMVCGVILRFVRWKSVVILWYLSVFVPRMLLRHSRPVCRDWDSSFHPNSVR